MIEPKWALLEVVKKIHVQQIIEHGGLQGIRAIDLLESALIYPRNLYFYAQEKPEIFKLGAAYAYRIIQNHPFNDGNKRTAYVVARLFLQLNKFDLKATPEERLKAILKVSEKIISEEELSEWFKDKSKSYDKRS